jgi:AcrR family transcriptional regulator
MVDDFMGPPFSSNEETNGRHGLVATARATILSRAVAIACVDGLEGLSIKMLASGLGISASDVFVLFGNRQALQLEVLDTTIEIFKAAIVKPTLEESSAIKRLLRLCEGWFDFVEQRGRGGCILYAAAEEYRSRPGPVRDRVNFHRTAWLGLLKATIAKAKRAVEFERDTDVEQLTFELTAFQEAAHSGAIAGDQAAFQRARNSCRNRVLEGRTR